MAYRAFLKAGSKKRGIIEMAAVDNPAMEDEYEAFSANTPTESFSIQLFAEEENPLQELLGAVIISDKEIFRESIEDSVVFLKDDVRAFRNEFMAHPEYHDKFNLMHDHEQRIPAKVVEVYIADTPAMITALEVEDVPEGSIVLMMRYFIENKDDWEFAKENLNGFSMEVEYDIEPLEDFSKNNLNQNNNIMSKIEKLVKNFKTAIEEFETPEVLEETPNPDQTFEDVTVAESGRRLRVDAVGAPVLEIVENDAGEEETQAATEGEYILEDGRVVVVDVDGNLVEIREADVEAEPIPEEDMEKPKEELETEETPAAEDKPSEELEDDATQDEKPKEELEETPTDDKGGSEVPAEVLAWFEKIGGAFAEAEVYTSFYKVDGKWYGTIGTAAYVEMQKELETLKAEKEEFNTKVEKLQAELEKPVAAPVFTQFNGESGKNKKSKEEFKNNLEYTLHRLGINKDE